MIKKTFLYSTLAILSLFVAYLFVTSKTTIQLGTAVLLYPLPVFFAHTLLRGKSKTSSNTTALNTSNSSVQKAEVVSDTSGSFGFEDIKIADIDKRVFLKIIGVAGVTLFLYSILNKNSENLFLGKFTGDGTTGLVDSDGNKINPAERQPTDSYVISEIDDDIIAFYGFINKDGGWYIMKEERDGGSFRYSKGDVNFPANWNNRKDLSYDYYHAVFG